MHVCALDWECVFKRWTEIVCLCTELRMKDKITALEVSHIAWKMDLGCNESTISEISILSKVNTK